MIDIGGGLSEFVYLMSNSMRLRYIDLCSQWGEQTLPSLASQPQRHLIAAVPAPTPASMAPYSTYPTTDATHKATMFECIF